jgi:hypothetical protein
MGRPLNKKFFGALTKSGFQVGCLADQGSGAVACYIVKQKSNRKYVVADVATGLVRATCKTVDSITGPGQMTVTVTPEGGIQTNAQITFDVAGGVVTAVNLVDGGYGYWTGGTITIDDDSDPAWVAGTAATVTYTVSNGAIASVALATPGSGFDAGGLTAQAVAVADLPATSAPAAEYAKIIRNNHVVTFGGNRYVWPAAGGAGSGSASGLPEATLQGS